MSPCSYAVVIIIILIISISETANRSYPRTITESMFWDKITFW